VKSVKGCAAVKSELPPSWMVEGCDGDRGAGSPSKVNAFRRAGREKGKKRRGKIRAKR